MSWNEKSSKDKTRAIALCDASGFFNCAINTQRDKGNGGETTHTKKRTTAPPHSRRSPYTCDTWTGRMPWEKR